MRDRDPITFYPCDDTKCHYRKQYRMKFDQKGQPYGVGMDGPADALTLCTLCTRRTMRDFFFDPAEEGKE